LHVFGKLHRHTPTFPLHLYPCASAIDSVYTGTGWSRDKANDKDPCGTGRGTDHLDVGGPGAAPRAALLRMLIGCSIGGVHRVCRSVPICGASVGEVWDACRPANS